MSSNPYAPRPGQKHTPEVMALAAAWEEGLHAGKHSVEPISLKEPEILAAVAAWLSHRDGRGVHSTNNLPGQDVGAALELLTIIGAHARSDKILGRSRRESYRKGLDAAFRIVHTNNLFGQDWDRTEEEIRTAIEKSVADGRAREEEPGP